MDRTERVRAYNKPAADRVALEDHLTFYWDQMDAWLEEDEEIFREEVHTTYLHELGHYLGLDEDDLFDRGLE